MKKQNKTVVGSNSNHELIKMEYVPTVVAKATDNLQKAIDEVKISVDPNMTH